MAGLCAALRTAKVEVDRHHATAFLGLKRHVEQRCWIIARKMRDEWTVVNVALEQIYARAWLQEVISADHRRIVELCAVPPCEQTKCKLATANHRSENDLVRRQFLARWRKRNGRGRWQQGLVVVA